MLTDGPNQPQNTQIYTGSIKPRMNTDRTDWSATEHRLQRRFSLAGHRTVEWRVGGQIEIVSVPNNRRRGAIVPPCSIASQALRPCGRLRRPGRALRAAANSPLSSAEGFGGASTFGQCLLPARSVRVDLLNTAV